MTEDFTNDNLAEWFKKIPGELCASAWELVGCILNELRNTGMDHNDMLRLGWIQEDNSVECLKISCTGGNFWAKILVDSWNTVAFASVTTLCLNTDKFHDCQRQIPQHTTHHRYSIFTPKSIRKVKTITPEILMKISKSNPKRAIGLAPKT